jgi:hypothetical protein
MSEDDLNRYRRDQERFFQELEEAQRRAERAIELKEFVEALRRSELELERIDRLEPQIAKLGRLAGMSDTAAREWAVSLVTQAKRILIKTTT